MADKLDVYDLLAALIPGALLVCLIPLLFPGVTQCAFAVALPGGFAVIALTVLSVFAGHTVQALASFIEPLIERTWKGRPSFCVLRGACSDRYFPADASARVRRKLITSVGNDASDASLFQYAAQLAENAGNPRLARFNALYGYHRGVLTLTLISLLLFAASVVGGTAAGYTASTQVTLLASNLGLLVLFWHRTRQRGYYYAREVLLTAERLLDKRSASSSVAVAAPGE